MSNDFYRAFEEKHRGSRELIKSRLTVYLPFVEPLLKIYSTATAIDLGCGRGEWLDLLQEHGFDAQGVDLDDSMLQACRERGLKVHTANALTFMQTLPNASQCIVSGFHIIEHLPFNIIQELFVEAKRVLKPGGVLIFETPNPENITVGSCSFHLDPTHLQPIPPELLNFLPEYYGFARFKILRLQEDKKLLSPKQLTLLNVLNGVSPDYAIVAQTEAPKSISEVFDTEFSKEFGITLYALAEQYQQQILQTSEQVQIMANHAQAQLKQALDVMNQGQQQIQRLLDRADQADALAAQSQREVDELSTKLSSVQRELLDANQINHTHWLQLEQTRKELHEVHQYNHHHWLLAEQRHQQLQAMLNSRSWRITAPLREANAALRPVIGKTLRFAVEKGKDLARRMPAFKRAALWVLLRFPVIARLVVRFSTTPFSAAPVHQAQIRHFEQLRSVRIMHALSQLSTNDNDGPVSFLKVSNDVN